MPNFMQLKHKKMECKGYPEINSDFSHLEGTDCYCSPEAATEIREAVKNMPLQAVHFLGTGDYHYLSLFWAERISGPFVLCLLDNHPDDQPGAFSEDTLSCGSWVPEVRKLPTCRGVKWIRKAGDYRGMSGSVYLSIDLDVLSEDYATTGWSQGTMTPDELCSIVRDIRGNCRLIGADICGGIRENPRINAAIMERICKTINGNELR